MSNSHLNEPSPPGASPWLLRRDWLSEFSLPKRERGTPTSYIHPKTCPYILQCVCFKYIKIVKIHLYASFPHIYRCMHIYPSIVFAPLVWTCVLDRFEASCFSSLKSCLELRRRRWEVMSSPWSSRGERLVKPYDKSWTPIRPRSANLRCNAAYTMFPGSWDQGAHLWALLWLPSLLPSRAGTVLLEIVLLPDRDFFAGGGWLEHG